MYLVMKLIKILLVFSLPYYSSFVYSQEISTSDAQFIAKVWIEMINGGKSKNFTVKETKDKLNNDKLSYRVVNFKEGGYVIISGETGLHPVIAYNATQCFEEIYLTQDEKDWLKFIEMKIENFRYKKKFSLKSAISDQNQIIDNLKSATTITSVPSLFESLHTSRWAGWYPYSIEEPYQNGANTCVPVAMTQIIKYYEFPLQGSGTNSYTWYDISTPVTLSANFGETYYNYNNMPFRLTYCGNGQNNCNEGSFDIIPGTTVEQMEEIGKLIYHCGIAVETDWQGQRDTLGGTLGTPGNWVQAMESYFNYASTWTYLNETYIAQNHEPFKTSLRNELNNGRPVLFAYYGPSWSHGHVIIADGYENDDYFHFAFNAGGFKDTYYYLFSSDDDDLHETLPYTTYYRAAIGIEPDCITTLNLANITISTSSIKAYSAASDINLSNFIIDGNGTTGGKVIAHAGNLINLNAGFEVKKGGEIEISIDECGTP